MIAKQLGVFAVTAIVAVIVATEWASSETLTIVSEPGIDVYGPLGSYAGIGDVAWGSPGAAVATKVHRDWPTLDGAVWISTAYEVEDPVNDSWRWFHAEFSLPSNAVSIEASVGMSATSDNAEAFYFNGTFVDSVGEVRGPFQDDHEWNTIFSYTIDPQPGLNTLDFIVRNYLKEGGTTESNPTGLLYKATITYDVPVPVSFSSLAATADNDMVTLRWTTGSETGNLGYHVYRSLMEDGMYEKLTASLIEGAGSSKTTQFYQFIDQDVEEGGSYFYKLEQINLDGSKVVYGPITATVAKRTVQPATWGLLKAQLK